MGVVNLSGPDPNRTILGFGNLRLTSEDMNMASGAHDQ